MKPRSITARKLVLVMVFIAVIGAYVLLILNGPDDSPQQRRVRLLYQTDHEALLKAGREILSKGPDPKKYRPFGPIHIDGFSVPRGVPIPRVIRKLRPHAVLINFNGYVVLHMTEGIENYGVKIYPDGFKTPRAPFRYGHRELLPGLWYYDYRCRRNPSYNKKIDEIVQTGRCRNLMKSIWADHTPNPDVHSYREHLRKTKPIRGQFAVGPAKAGQICQNGTRNRVGKFTGRGPGAS